MISATQDSTSAVDALTGRLRPVLESEPELRLALIFGSYAGARTGPRSDVDLAVAGAGRLSWEARARIAGKASDAVRREVDLLDLWGSHGLILREALTRGRLVFCRDRFVYASLIQRMWGEEADFLPTLRALLRRRLEAWIQP